MQSFPVLRVRHSKVRSGVNSEISGEESAARRTRHPYEWISLATDR